MTYTKSKGLTDTTMHYCPGCTHGTIHKLIAEVLVELDVVGDTIGVAPVGCSILCYDYFNFDMQEAAHGRAPALATGIRRALPEATVFTYQGDGDLASIGTAEIIHAANRGENFTTIFVNNAIYGMTGGQMAPTTLIGQKTTTTQNGRTAAISGNPMRMSEMIATIQGAAYVERVSVDSPANTRKAKKAIKHAFECQLQGKGFSMVEVLSTCPTNWGKTPVDSLEWVKTAMIPYFPLKKFKDYEDNV